MPLLRANSAHYTSSICSSAGLGFEPPDTRTARPPRSCLASRRHRRPQYTKVRFSNPDGAAYTDYGSQIDANHTQRIRQAAIEQIQDDSKMRRLRSGQKMDEMQQFRRAKRHRPADEPAAPKAKKVPAPEMSPASRIQRAKDKIFQSKSFFQTNHVGGALSLPRSLSTKRWWPAFRPRDDHDSSFYSDASLPMSHATLDSDQVPSYWKAPSTDPYGFSTYARPSSSRRSSLSSMSRHAEGSLDSQGSFQKQAFGLGRSHSFGGLRTRQSIYNPDPYASSQRSGERRRSSMDSVRRSYPHGPESYQRHTYKYPPEYSSRPSSSRSDRSFVSSYAAY